MSADEAIDVRQLTHAYGTRTALNETDLRVQRGEIFAVLGPNGSGKTTLFRILSTLLPPQAGKVRVLGHDVGRDAPKVRKLIGVGFQATSLDKKLTVDENLAQQAYLYGIHGRQLRDRRSEVLQRLGITDRRSDFVETLSGGLKRRVDLAKSLLHQPTILLLDEPSTGLDPGARSDLWRYLRGLRETHGMTLMVTTHLLEEADRADRIMIMNEGQVVATGEPGKLRESIGEHSITVESDFPEKLCEQLNRLWNCQATLVGRDVRFPSSDRTNQLPRLIEEFPDLVKSVKLGRPTLEDVFIEKTGHRFWQDNDGEPMMSQEKESPAR